VVPRVNGMNLRCDVPLNYGYTTSTLAFLVLRDGFCRREKGKILVGSRRNRGNIAGKEVLTFFSFAESRNGWGTLT